MKRLTALIITVPVKPSLGNDVIICKDLSSDKIIQQSVRQHLLDRAAAVVSGWLVDAEDQINWGKEKPKEYSDEYMGQIYDWFCDQGRDDDAELTQQFICNGFTLAPEIDEMLEKLETFWDGFNSLPDVCVRQCPDLPYCMILVTGDTTAEGETPDGEGYVLFETLQKLCAFAVLGFK